MISGIAISGVIIGVGAPTPFAEFGFWWLFGSSAVVLAVMLLKRKIDRCHGILIAFVWVVCATVTFAMAR